MNNDKLINRVLAEIIQDANVNLESLAELIRKNALNDFSSAYLQSQNKSKKGPSESAVFEFANDLRNSSWQANHAKIKHFILNHLSEYGSMPRTGQIATETKLSTTTVCKHLKEYDQSEFFGDELKKYQLAFFGVVDRVLLKCMKGDIKAMRLYFDIMAFTSKYRRGAGFLLDSSPIQPGSKPDQQEESDQLAQKREWRLQDSENSRATESVFLPIREGHT